MTTATLPLTLESLNRRIDELELVSNETTVEVTTVQSAVSAGPLILSAANGDGGSLVGLRPQIKIDPVSTLSTEGVAMIVLAPNDLDSKFAQGRTAIIQFHPERKYEADGTLKAHRHYYNTTLTGNHTFPTGTVTVGSTTNFASAGKVRVYATDTTFAEITYTGKTATTLTGCTGGTGTFAGGSMVVSDQVEMRHIQFHTTNLAGVLTDRFLIEYGKDDPAIQISTAHLQFHTDAYILGQGGSVTGAVPVRGVIDVTSQNATTSAQIQIGRTAADVRIGVAGSAGSISSSAAQADMVIRHDTATNQIIIQTGNGGGAIRVSATAGNVPKLGFFGTAPIAQPAGGALTAGATYGANEQSMLQKVYDAHRTLGLMA